MTDTSKNRIEVLNWRKHCDDEAYCRGAAFPAGDTRTLDHEVDEYLDITPENRRRWAEMGDPEPERIAEGKLWYKNDHLVFEDGDVIEHNGRKFLIQIEEVKR